MIKFNVTNRFTGAVKFTAEIDCGDSAGRSLKLGLAVKWAIKTGANLRDANLGGADLRDANLGGADLRGANLRDANLRDANLGDANLGDADLRDANLGGANLRDANLGDADLRDANLRDANLRDANLRDANLRDAVLGGLWLSQGPTRIDGYDYKVWSSIMGGCVITAGCRTWAGEDAIEQAREHCQTRTDEKHRAQALRIVDYLEGELKAYREATNASD